VRNETAVWPGKLAHLHHSQCGSTNKTLTAAQGCTCHRNKLCERELGTTNHLSFSSLIDTVQKWNEQVHHDLKPDSLTTWSKSQSSKFPLWAKNCEIEPWKGLSRSTIVKPNQKLMNNGMSGLQTLRRISFLRIASVPRYVYAVNPRFVCHNHVASKW
jgi:hypothetical protein